MQIDVTAVINLHREGNLCVASMQSLDAAASHAETLGLTVERLVVLDRSDSLTTEVARVALGDQAVLLPVEHGDLGHARNAAVDSAVGQFVGFLDSDDLWGRSWLSRAHAAAVESTVEAVWHPEFNFIIGKGAHVYHHLGSEDQLFRESRFRIHNSWTALSFARTSLYRDVPYPPNLLELGHGFEDWSWNAEILRRGIPHRVVANSCHFIDKRAETMLASSQHALPTRYGSFAKPLAPSS